MSLGVLVGVIAKMLSNNSKLGLPALLLEGSAQKWLDGRVNGSGGVRVVE